MAEELVTSDNPDMTWLPFARGLYWPPWPTVSNWEANLERLANFEPRDEDIFVISYPKCGQSWMNEILSMILHGKSELVAGEIV